MEQGQIELSHEEKRLQSFNLLRANRLFKKSKSPITFEDFRKQTTLSNFQISILNTLLPLLPCKLTELPHIDFDEVKKLMLLNSALPISYQSDLNYVEFDIGAECILILVKVGIIEQSSSISSVTNGGRRIKPVRYQ